MGQQHLLSLQIVQIYRFPCQAGGMLYLAVFPNFGVCQQGVFLHQIT
ncbi:MAG: hypothetical protein GY869_15095 [Planctomycetes bacterium]|nr:hypothetical protein [Planctomycetota bacterium]